MKLPKVSRRFCPYCNEHTKHKIAPAKKRNASPFKRGSKIRAKLRGAGVGTGNHGRLSRKAMGSWKMTGKKLAKKSDLRLTCEKCNKTHVMQSSYRARKIEFV
jgi:ribosomal protein L44E